MSSARARGFSRENEKISFPEWGSLLPAGFRDTLHALLHHDDVELTTMARERIADVIEGLEQAHASELILQLYEKDICGLTKDGRTRRWPKTEEEWGYAKRIFF